MLLYSPSICLPLKSLVCLKAFLLVFLSPARKSKQKPCRSLKLQGCISSFQWTSPEEVQELPNIKLEGLFLAIFWCAMDLKTIKGHLDLAYLHIWVWLLKSQFPLFWFFDRLLWRLCVGDDKAINSLSSTIPWISIGIKFIEI